MKKIEKLLVCVGAQKGGTTWLHEVLAKDVRLKMPLFRKEVQYFNYKHINSPLINEWRAAWLINLAKKQEFQQLLVSYLQQDSKKNALMDDKNKVLLKRIGFCLNPLNDDWYCDYMATGPKKTCAVDISPEYALIGKAGFENINAVTDDLKIVFILRDPIERSWSGMIQELKNKPDASEKLKQMANAPLENLIKRAKTPNIQKRSDYLSTFKAIYAAGLSDKLKVLFYDDIVNQPSQIMSDVYDHIQITKPLSENEMFDKVIHKSPTVIMPKQFMLAMQEFYKPMLAQLNNEFIRLPDVWKNRYGL